MNVRSSLKSQLRHSVNSGTAGHNAMSLPGSVNLVGGNDSSYDHLMQMGTGSLENHITAIGVVEELPEGLDPQ